MSRILIPLPRRDYDPTEAAVPWLALIEGGHRVDFATPDGLAAAADSRMLCGQGLGPWRSLLMADSNGLAAHQAMAASEASRNPIRYQNLAIDDYDGIVLPGGHAAGMVEYLESERLQELIAQAFARAMPVGAICHGVVLAARSRGPDGKSVLFGRQTTALTRMQELSAWAITALWLGSYYRTYAITVQAEVTAALANAGDFKTGPAPLLRDSPTRLNRGYTVADGNYLSARWPGDAHRFARQFVTLMAPDK